jgi:hypothetical protein
MPGIGLAKCGAGSGLGTGQLLQCSMIPFSPRQLRTRGGFRHCRTATPIIRGTIGNDWRRFPGLFKVVNLEAALLAAGPVPKHAATPSSRRSDAVASGDNARAGPPSMRGPLSSPGRDERGTSQTSIRHHPQSRGAMRRYAVGCLVLGAATGGLRSRGRAKGSAAMPRGDVRGSRQGEEHGCKREPRAPGMGSPGRGHQ